MFRDLLVHVDGSDAGRRRLQFAIDLALRTGARLSGLHVMPPPDVPPLYKPSQLDEAVANMSRRLAANARAAKEAFSEEVARRLTDTRWVELDGDVVDGICDRARYADLVILGQYEWQGPHVAHPLPIAHSVISRCGRPVLVVPAAVGPITFAKVAIAWDGSREAVRAVPLAEHRPAADLVALLRYRVDDLVTERLHQAAQLFDISGMRDVVDTRELDADEDRTWDGRFGFHDAAVAGSFLCLAHAYHVSRCVSAGA